VSVSTVRADSLLARLAAL